MRRPFEAGNQLALACMIVQQEPGKLPESCPQDVAKLIAKLLDKDPLSRLRVDELAQSRNAPEDGSSALAHKTCPGSRFLSPEAKPKHRLSHSPSPSPTKQLSSRSGTPVKPRSAFGGLSTSPPREETRDQRKSLRRRWPSLRRGLRSTLSRAVFTNKKVRPVVEKEDIATDVDANTASCPSGHALERFATIPPSPCHRSIGHHCSKCQCTAHVGALMWGCRTCTFYVCDPCCRGESVLKLVPVDSEDLDL